jgi:BirA family transcriptional regulator, biotin operon repressor / biotin---[acetyl-CoA-carboxylase] ligase
VGDGPRYEGADVRDLAARLGVPAVHYRAVTPSTQDEVHRLANAGASAGTIVLADAQTAGRGRGRRPWTSHPGAGIWLTLLERPNDVAAIEVLALRLGIGAAHCLDRFADDVVRLKWPNDLFVGRGKVAGILVEARWRETRPEWVAIGFGLNVVAPVDIATASGLRAGVSRLEVLEELVPVMRAAAAARGPLSRAELSAFAERDLAIGRRCAAPGAGVVRGLAPTGELLIASGDAVQAFRGGSLVLMEDP